MAALERTIAARYLKLPRPRTWRLHLITITLLVGWIGARVALWWLRRRPLFGQPPWVQTAAGYAVVGLLVAVVLVGFFVFLNRHFTIFTAISTFGLYLGSAALVVVLSVMSGFEQDLKQKILGANAHVTITSPDRPLTDYVAVELKIRGATDGKVSAFLSGEVMMSSQSNLAGVVLKGIDPASVGDVTDLGKNMREGSLDNLVHPEKLRGLGGPQLLLEEDDDRPASPGKAPADVELLPTDSHGRPLKRPELPGPTRKVLPGVIVGQELAKNLRLYVGDDVNMISPMGDIGPAGPMPRSRPFRVAGIFYSGMYEYDTKFVYMSIQSAQRFLGMPDEVTGFEIRVADPDHSERVVGRLRAALGSAYDVQDWKALNRNLFSALWVEKVAMFIVLCFIILVAGFSIVANGIMLVHEKRREIAILKSMGATDRTVLGVFLYIGLYLGSLGVAVGIAVGVGACLLLGKFGIALDTDVYYINKLPVRLNPYEIVAVFLAAMAIVLGATLYPALSASRLRPVDGLRYDQA